VRVRQVVIALIVASCVTLIDGCGPTKHHPVDDWANDELVEPEITGNNAKDEARWRQELGSDPFADDAHLIGDDPTRTAAEDEDESAPPKDFVGPPAPPTKWQNAQKSGSKVGRVLFSLLTVFVTLGMMAAPYLLMI
jgi:hypothetical protein